MKISKLLAFKRDVLGGNMKKIIKTVLMSLLMCIGLVFVSAVMPTDASSMTEAKAEETTLKEIDMGTLLGTDYEVFSGNKTYEIGQSDFYTVKARIYLQVGYNVTFYLNTDGNGTNGHPYGGATSFRLKDDTDVMWGWPAAWHITNAGTWYGKTLEAEKTYSLEFGIKNIDDTNYNAFVSIDGEVWEFVGTTNDVVFHGGYGTLLGISGSGIVFEKSTATCNHQISADWTDPNAAGEIYRQCVHCGLVLEKGYYADTVDFSAVANKDTAFLSGQGVLGAFEKEQSIGMKMRMYLPEEGKYNLNFAIMGDGKTISSTGELYGAFVVSLTPGSVSIAGLKGYSSSDLDAGKTVILEFGVYTMTETEHRAYVKVNGNVVLSVEGTEKNTPIGTKITYAFSRGTLLETADATCEHAAGEVKEANAEGLMDVVCSNCSQVLYQQHVQTVYDVSEFIGNESYTLKQNDLCLMNMNKEEYVSVKGMMHIPYETDKNFTIDVYLQTDASTKAANGMYDGLYLLRLQNGTAMFSLPWAAHFYWPYPSGANAIKPGSTFTFEIGLYQVTDMSHLRYAYLKINDKTIVEYSYCDLNYAYGTYFAIQTTQDIVLLSAESTCTSGIHSISDWSDMDASMKSYKICTKCDMKVMEKEHPSTVTFESNLVGLVEMNDTEVFGSTLIYNIPNVKGYKITDIKANDASVFTHTEELEWGYRLALPRDSLSYAVFVQYEPQKYAVSYAYNTACTVKVENTQVGYGDSARYTITMKNGNDIVSAKVGDIDVTENLVKINGDYILTVKNVKSDTRLEITAEIKSYTITLQDTVGGSLSSNKTSVNAFETAVISATLTKGYALNYYLVNGVKTASKNGVLTIENITENITVSAIYTSLETETPPSDTDSNVEPNSGCSSYMGASVILPLLIAVGFILKKKEEAK